MPRGHEDVDVSLLASDVPALYHHLKHDWHLWNNNEGTLHPLTDEHPAAPAARTHTSARPPTTRTNEPDDIT